MFLSYFDLKTLCFFVNTENTSERLKKCSLFGA